MKKKPLILALAVLSIVCITVVLYDFNVIPHKKYPGSDFGIPAYQSPCDLDAYPYYRRGCYGMYAALRDR